MRKVMKLVSFCKMNFNAKKFALESYQHFIPSSSVADSLSGDSNVLMAH